MPLLTCGADWWPCFSFNIVFGILVAFFSNYIIEANAWRWMLGVESLPAALFFGFLFLIPESPRWLVKKNRNEEARDVLIKLGISHHVKILEEIKDSLKVEKAGIKEKLFSKIFSFPIMLAILLATFNQFSGINA